MNLEILKIIIKEVAWFAIAFIFTIIIAAVLFFVTAIFVFVLVGQQSTLFDNDNIAFIILLALLSQNLAFLICALWRKRIEGQILDDWAQRGNKTLLLKNIRFGGIVAVVLLLAVYLQ